MKFFLFFSFLVLCLSISFSHPKRKSQNNKCDETCFYEIVFINSKGDTIKSLVNFVKNARVVEGKKRIFLRRDSSEYDCTVVESYLQESLNYLKILTITPNL